MIERVIENWLTKANEREYQFPFCQVLISKGFRVLHISSHGPQEQGKDVIALDQAGRPVAYQLKTGNIDLTHFRKIKAEIHELIEVPIQYPGIPADGRHRCVLVTNGTLTDTVRRQVDDLNRKWVQRREPVLEVIVKGDLLRDFLDLHGAFFPIQLGDVNQLLELYLCNGSAPFPHKQFSEFLLKNVPLGDLHERGEKVLLRRRVQHRKPQFSEIARHLASTSLLVSYTLHSFGGRKNFWAIFEAWIMFGAHILAVAERLALSERHWKDTFDLSFLAARTALASLIEESSNREHLLEGEVLVESAVYRARITILMGLMAAYHLICRLRKVDNRHIDRIRAFIREHKRDIYLWGESAVPYLLLLGWYLETTGAPSEAEGVWALIVKALVTQNQPQRNRAAACAALPDPYLECEDALARAIGVKREDSTDSIDYDGQAYSLRGLVLLLARRMRRRLLSSLWYDITNVNFTEMYPDPSWGILLWRSPKGDLRITQAKRPQSWVELTQEAGAIDVSVLPQRLVGQPDFLTAFLCVYPHRLRADTVKVIDDAI